MNSFALHGTESVLIAPAVLAAVAICHDLATHSFKRQVDLNDRSFPIVLKESSRMILLGRIISLLILLAGPAAAWWFSFSPDWQQRDWILPLFISFMGGAFWVMVSQEKDQSIVIHEDSFTYHQSAKKSVTVRAIDITEYDVWGGNLVIKRYGEPRNLVISLEIWGPDRAYLRAILDEWQRKAMEVQNRAQDMRCNVPGFGFAQDN